MPNYTMGRPRYQEVKISDLAGKPVDGFIDLETGALMEKLRDEKFPWRERKQATLRLADIYKYAGMDKEAEKAKTCSIWLEYLATGKGDRELRRFSGCYLRLCPLCQARKAKLMAWRLLRIMEFIPKQHKNVQFIFLTLTIENVEGDKLREALDQLTAAWNKFTRRRPFARAVKGWFRAIEITRNKRTGTYHPHIHAILCVEDDYFNPASGLYLKHEDYRKMWAESLRVDYLPMVRIQRTKDKGKRGRGGKGEAAAVEAAKYACKDEEYIDPRLPIAEAASIATTYTTALHRKRLTALGGWMLEASKMLDIDMEDESDLVHADEDGKGKLTETTAELLERFDWHFRLSHHLLTDRRNNPEFLGNLPSASGGSAEAPEVEAVEMHKENGGGKGG